MSLFIHTADTHLGYRQYHRPEREEDYLQAFEQVITGAIENDAEAVIHGGDLFHDSRPTTPTIRAALEQLRRLEENDIDFLGVVGNHEETQADQWLDIFSELGLATHLNAEPHIIDDVAFYGIDNIPESKRRQLTYDFDDHTAEYAFLVLHGLVSPLSPYGTWDIEQILGMSSVEFDAVLLGDDHTPRIDRINDTVITYPGATERTATDQTHERVYNLISTDNEEPEVWIEQVELDTRPHTFLNIELEPGEGQERIYRELDEDEITDSIVAITVTGEGEDITPAAIEEYGKEQGAFVVRVSDRRQLENEELEIDVTFADPDDAIQNRVRKMGLSVPAYDIEQRVRDTEAIPISNLAQEIENEFDRRIDENHEEFEKLADIDAPDSVKGKLSEFTDTNPSDEEYPPGDSQITEEGEEEEEEEGGTEEETTTSRSSQLSFDDLE